MKTRPQHKTFQNVCFCLLALQEAQIAEKDFFNDAYIIEYKQFVSDKNSRNESKKLHGAKNETK